MTTVINASFTIDHPSFIHVTTFNQHAAVRCYHAYISDIPWPVCFVVIGYTGNDVINKDLAGSQSSEKTTQIPVSTRVALGEWVYTHIESETISRLEYKKSKSIAKEMTKREKWNEKKRETMSNVNKSYSNKININSKNSFKSEGGDSEVYTSLNYFWIS